MAEKSRYQIEDLCYLMARLRDPHTGCPWDLKQDFASVLPHTLEEVYEVADAIDRDDKLNLREELGDLLFQVVFYAQLGREEGSFDFESVVDGIVRKLVRRHPHVFPAGTLESRREAHEPVSEADIKANWQKIKAAEKAASDKPLPVTTSSLDAVPLAAPALARAEKIQKIAARQGFDWPDIAPVFDKMREEMDELATEINATDQEAQARQQRMEEELGDVLFTCVNLARFVNVSPERALTGANRRFAARFAYIEQQLAQQGSKVCDTPLDELERLWLEAKAQLNKV